MRIILCCGDRNWKDEAKIRKYLSRENKKHKIDFVIEGGQKTAYQGSWGEDSWKGFYGADYFCRRVAQHLGIQTITCEANWLKFKKSAGPIRNQKQLDVALILSSPHNVKTAFDVYSSKEIKVLAFHSDLKNSKGTKDMVNRAKKAGVRVKVIK